MSANPPAITFVSLLHEIYVPAVGKYIMVIPAWLHNLCVREAPNEKLKINELGPNLDTL